MRARKEIRIDTHINFDVEVLEVERVFPDIDTDDGDMSEERILVSSSDNLEDLVARVQTLMDGWMIRSGPITIIIKTCKMQTTVTVIRRKKHTHEPSPAGALDPSSSGVKLLLQVINTAERLINGDLERASFQHAAVALPLRGGRREVLPEQGVVDVA